MKAACSAFPDTRKQAVTYSMTDIGLSAFSLFFMQSESFLSYQRSLEESGEVAQGDEPSAWEQNEYFDFF